LIPMYNLNAIPTYSTERLEAERDECIGGIGKIKQKMIELPKAMKKSWIDMMKAKMAYGTVHQLVITELGRRNRKQRLERLKVVESAFVTLAKEHIDILGNIVAYLKRTGLDTPENSLTFTIQNSGKRDGDEVVQVYYRHVNSKVPQPKLALCGFSRVSVKSGKSAAVTIEVPAERLRYWDTDKKQYIVEPGDYEFLIRAASDDIRLTLPMTFTDR